jgi:hypothetical protein
LFAPPRATTRSLAWLPPAEDRTPSDDPYLAPPVGFADEHPANGTGWLVATGGTAVRLRSPAVNALLTSGGTTLTLGLIYVTGGLGALGSFAVLAGGAATMTLTLATADHVMRRRLLRAPRVTRLGDAPPGAVVRLCGRVAPQETMRSLFERRPAVLCRSRQLLADETRGVDFWLETAAAAGAGERVRVHIRAAMVLDRPERLPPGGHGASAHEVVIGPGDGVEVAGVLTRQATPAGEAAPGRGTPLSWSLRAPRGGFLLIRRARQPG